MKLILALGLVMAVLCGFLWWDDRRAWSIDPRLVGEWSAARGPGRLGLKISLLGDGTGGYGIDRPGVRPYRLSWSARDARLRLVIDVPSDVPELWHRPHVRELRTLGNGTELVDEDGAVYRLSGAKR